MLINWKVKMMGFLCALTLFSVGFSSWSVTGGMPRPYDTEGGIETDYVIKTDNYVYFSKDEHISTEDGIVLPKYNAAGFVAESVVDGNKVYTNSSTAQMTLYFTVNYAKYLELKNDDTRTEKTMDITCEITLAFNASQFFNNTLQTTGGFTIPSEVDGLTETQCEKIEDTSTTPAQCIGYIITLKGYNLEKLTANGLIEIPITLKVANNKDAYVAEYLTTNKFVFNTKAYMY